MENNSSGNRAGVLAQVIHEGFMWSSQSKSGLLFAGRWLFVIIWAYLVYCCDNSANFAEFFADLCTFAVRSATQNTANSNWIQWLFEGILLILITCWLSYSFTVFKLMNRLPYATDRNCTSNGSLAESSCILWLAQEDIWMGFFVSYSSVLMQSCWTKFRTYSNLHHFFNCRKFSPDI